MHEEAGSALPKRGWGGARRGAGGRRGPGPATVERHRFIVEWLARQAPAEQHDLDELFHRLPDRKVYLHLALLLALEGDPIRSAEMTLAAAGLPNRHSRGMLRRTERFLEARATRRARKEKKPIAAKLQS